MRNLFESIVLPEDKPLWTWEEPRLTEREKILIQLGELAETGDDLCYDSFSDYTYRPDIYYRLLDELEASSNDK